MGLKDSFKSCMKNYLSFKGRASRSEFWWFELSCLIIIYGTWFICELLIDITDKQGWENLIFIVAIALLLPQLSVMGRRYQDIGIPAWIGITFFIVLSIATLFSGSFKTSNSLIIILVGGSELIGWIVFYWLMCKKGISGVNKFGMNPLEKKFLLNENK